MDKHDKTSEPDCETPVTVIVKRRPRPGREAEFEEVMAGITRAAMTFEGHLGINIFRPSKSSRYYRIVFKFDSRRNYLRWEDSLVRQQWLNRFAELECGDSELQVLSGLETWFTTADEESVVPPPRHKMVIVLWLSISVLSYLLNAATDPLFDTVPMPLRVALNTLLIVLLMTYLVMPLLTRRLQRWLHAG